jgi:hypothetical protein
VLAVVLIAALAAARPASAKPDARASQSLRGEESADVFLAKATLQQYLSREVRKDWDGVRRLTHPKALSTSESPSRAAQLSPWKHDAQLKTFEFRGAREVSPGIVAVAVAEEASRSGRHEDADDVPAVYVLVKTRDGFRVADRKPDAELGEVREQSVASLKQSVDPQARAQGRTPAPDRARAHR